MTLKKEDSKPLYVQIMDYLIEEIKIGNLKHGDILPAELALAEKFKVSRLTIRKAYSEMAKKGMLYSVQGKGTFVAEEKKVDAAIDKIEKSNLSKDKKTIGLIFPDMNSFAGPIIMAIEERAAQFGYTVIIKVNENIEKERQAIESVIENEVDGIIIIPYRSNKMSSYENYKKIIDSNIPFVFIGKPPFNIPSDSVMLDDITISYLAVETLILNGNKNIVHVIDSEFDLQAVFERKEGYIRAMNSIAPELTIQIIDVADDNFEEQVFELINKKDGGVGMFCESDHIAGKALNILNARNVKIPAEAEIIGFGDSSICELLPQKLTSISAPRKKLGYKAFELINRKLITEEDESEDIHIMIKQTLVFRETTK